MQNVVGRLVERFPTLGRGYVQGIVYEEVARLADGRVREYIPALVEHAAEDRLRQEAKPVDITAGDPGGPAVVPDEASELDPLEVERKAREQRAGFLFGDPGGGPI